MTAHSSKVRLGLIIFSSKNIFLTHNPWHSLHAQLWELKEKLDIDSSSGMCPQLEQINTLENHSVTELSHCNSSIFNCPFQILKVSSKESFNLFTWLVSSSL